MKYGGYVMFQKNLEAIREKNPNLAEKLEKIDLEEIKDEIVVAEAETKDLIIGYEGVALHSMVDPLREAKALWNRTIRTEPAKNDVQIIFGLGLGYLFKRAYVSAVSRIYIVEPFINVLRFVLEHVDLSAELSDKRVYITDNTKDVISRLRAQYLQGDKAEFLFLPAYASLAKSQLEELTEKTLKVLEEKTSDVNTIFQLAPGWTLNFTANLPCFAKARPLGFFRDLFADKAAILVSPGPSLVENIQKIKENRDKFVIISAGKAIKALSANGIIPDFVTFADAQGTWFQTEGFEDTLRQTHIIMTSKTDNAIARLDAKSKIIYLSDTDNFESLFNRHSPQNPGNFDSAGSVAIINYFVARALGFTKIAFVGLDLAFPGNKLYATGEPLKTDPNGYIEMDGGVSIRKIRYVKDKNGNEIPTRDDYLVFIRHFEDIIEEDTLLSEVVNTSSNGAYIKGMKYAEFDEFVAGLDKQEFNIDETLFSVFNSTANEWQSCIKAITDEYYGEKPEIIEINREAATLAEGLSGIMEEVEQNKTVKDTEKVEELLQKSAEMRGKIMDNLILQNLLQGVLWEYTKNIRTERLFNRDSVVCNLKTEKTLLEQIRNLSTSVLKQMEESAQQPV